MTANTLDVDLSTFAAEVVEASHRTPVVVDFWAPWCGPCRALGPILEKLAGEYAERVRVVKVNSDENPELSREFGVRGIPYVMAFDGGRPVDAFTGALPESRVREFFARLLPGPSEVERRRARQLAAAGDSAGAAQALRQALALDPSNDDARIDSAELLLATGEAQAAREQLDAVAPRNRSDAYERLAARVSAVLAAAALPSADELESRLAADPGDLEARFGLAELHVAEGDYEPALAQLLAVVRADRGFRDDGARRRMLDVFRLAETRPDLVARYRRELASVLNA